MDNIRKGEIALALIRQKLREEGFRITPNLRREMNNTASQIGIPPEELSEFMKILVREMVEEMFPHDNHS